MEWNIQNYNKIIFNEKLNVIAEVTLNAKINFFSWPQGEHQLRDA